MDLTWWCVEFRAQRTNRFKGVVIVDARSIDHALERISKRELNPGGVPIINTFSNEVMFIIPDDKRWKLLNSVEAQKIKDDLDNYFEQVYV